MKFIQYIPGFMRDEEPPIEFEFNDISELLSHDICKNFMKNYEHDLYPHLDSFFYRFSIENKYGNTTLIAEYDDGFNWYVVGYITDYNVDYFPEWKKPSDEQANKKETDKQNNKMDILRFKKNVTDTLENFTETIEEDKNIIFEYNGKILKLENIYLSIRFNPISSNMVFNLKDVE